MKTYQLIWALLKNDWSLRKDLGVVELDELISRERFKNINFEPIKKRFTEVLEKANTVDFHEVAMRDASKRVVKMPPVEPLPADTHTVYSTEEERKKWADYNEKRKSYLEERLENYKSEG